MVEDGSRDGPGDGEWLTVAAAARRLGVSPRAIRGRIRRGTISTKANGNAGKLVLVRPGDVSADGPEDDPGDERELLREELAEARVTIARLEERVEAARAVAVADVATARAELEARERYMAQLEAMLAEARKPWWSRWFAKR